MCNDTVQIIATVAMVAGSCIMLYAIFRPEKKQPPRPAGHYAVKIAGRWTVAELRTDDFCGEQWTIIGNEDTYATHELDSVCNIEIFTALEKLRES